MLNFSSLYVSAFTKSDTQCSLHYSCYNACQVGSAVAQVLPAVAGNMQNSFLPFQTEADLNVFTPNAVDLLSTTGAVKCIQGNRRISPLLNTALLHISNTVIPDAQSNIMKLPRLSSFTCRGW